VKALAIGSEPRSMWPCAVAPSLRVRRRRRRQRCRHQLCLRPPALGSCRLTAAESLPRGHASPHQRRHCRRRPWLALVALVELQLMQKKRRRRALAQGAALKWIMISFVAIGAADALSVENGEPGGPAGDAWPRARRSGGETAAWFAEKGGPWHTIPGDVSIALGPLLGDASASRHLRSGVAFRVFSHR